MLSDSNLLRVFFKLGKWVGLYHYDKCEIRSELVFSRTSYAICAVHLIFSICYLILVVYSLLTQPFFTAVFNRILMNLLMVEMLIANVKPILICGIQLIFSKKIMNFLNRVLLQCRLMNVDFSKNEQISRCIRMKKNSLYAQTVLFLIEVLTVIDEPVKIEIVAGLYAFWYMTIYRSIFIDGGLLLCLGFHIELNEKLKGLLENNRWSDEDFSYMSVRLRFLIAFKSQFHKFFSVQIFCVSSGSILLFLSPVRCGFSFKALLIIHSLSRNKPVITPPPFNCRNMTLHLC